MLLLVIDVLPITSTRMNATMSTSESGIPKRGLHISQEG